MTSTKTITFSPRTLQALERAARMYEGVASQTLKVYHQPTYRFPDVDLAVAGDVAQELRLLLGQLT